MIVPAHAARIMIVISSAGAPSAVGIYVVDNLLVSRIGANGEPEVLLRSPFDTTPRKYADNYVPDGWIHDGLHPSMAEVVEVGTDPPTPAFAILDDDPFSHAEWHNIFESAPKVTPGDHIVVEWNEAYSIGGGNFASASYNSLPAGTYYISKPLRLKSSQGLMGAGMANTVIIAKDPTQDMIVGDDYGCL